jgi:hypothetical protein
LIFLQKRKLIFKGTVLLIGLLALTAIVSLLLHDYKERKWYMETYPPGRVMPGDTTLLCILATVHQAGKNYNADSIVGILNSFQPDLILTEEDTLLFQ